MSQVGLEGLGDPKKSESLLRNSRGGDKHIPSIYVPSILSVPHTNTTSRERCLHLADGGN